MLKEVGSLECPNCEACKESVEHVFFQYAHVGCMIPRYKFLHHLKEVLAPDTLYIVLLKPWQLFWIKLQLFRRKARFVC